MKRVFALLVLFAFASSAVWAAPAQPDPAKNPALAAFQKSGAKFYYLGERMGLNGWFITQNGQVQMAYATADNKGAVIGALLGPGGENISAEQVTTLMQTNKDFADIMTAIQNEQAAMTQPPGAAAAPASTIGTMPATPLSPGERLMQDLSAASTVVIGKPSSPEILMVMDTRCPHCQATMRALHDAVARGDLHMRLIPIAEQGTDSERTEAMLLSSPDPFAAWTRYIGGDASALAGTPSDAALGGIRANHQIIDNWKIGATPYLVYRGHDGKVKIVQGEPKLPILLKDLGL